MLSKAGDSWVRWLMEISFSCTLWNFILGEICVPVLLHSWSLTCCEFQHRAALSDPMTLGRVLVFLICCQVLLSDRGCFLSSSLRRWGNSLPIHLCSLEKVEQSLEGGDLRDQPQNRCSRKTTVPSACWCFQPLGSQWFSVAQLIPDDQPKESCYYQECMEGTAQKLKGWGSACRI